MLLPSMHLPTGTGYSVSILVGGFERAGVIVQMPDADSNLGDLVASLHD